MSKVLAYERSIRYRNSLGVRSGLRLVAACYPEKGKDAYEAKLKKCDNVAADVTGKQECINKVQKDGGKI